jgi:hypothetical protein
MENAGLFGILLTGFRDTKAKKERHECVQIHDLSIRFDIKALPLKLSIEEH